MGRPTKYSTEEERKKAIQESRKKYISNKEWRCPQCGDFNYTMARKWNHLKTKKHIENTKAMQS